MLICFTWSWIHRNHRTFFSITMSRWPQKSEHHCLMVNNSPGFLIFRGPLRESSSGRNHLRELCSFPWAYTMPPLTFLDIWCPLISMRKQAELFICLEPERAPACQLSILTLTYSKSFYFLFFLLLWYLQWIYKVLHSPVKMAGFGDV